MTVTNQTTFQSLLTGARKGLLAAGLLLLGSAAQAATLNLTKTFPDMFVGSLDIGFVTDGDGGQLTISGDPASFTEVSGGNQNPIQSVPDFDDFTLEADIDAAGNVLSGSFSSAGQVRDVINPLVVLFDGPVSAGGLLNGNLDLFGFAGSTNTGILEFTFNTVSGVINDDLGPFSAGGIIISVSSSSMANFDVDVLTTNWTGGGVADVFVPVPAAVWLFGSGLIGLLGVARQRRR